jgi:PAS domain-containing protein
VVGSCLYDKHGNLFAEYRRTEKIVECGKTSTETEGSRFEGGSVTQYRTISLSGEKVGSIAIVSDLEDLQAKIRQYTLISARIIFISVWTTFLVSSRLIRLITGPILQLAGTASRVTEQEDYGLRAVSSGNDEVGMLISAFNQMLERIQERDEALQNSNSQLEDRVRRRTQEFQEEVNERVRAEEALSKERSMLRALIDNVPDFMYVKDTESRFVVGNASVARSMGSRRPDELLQKTDFDFLPKEQAQRYFEDEQNVIRTKQANSGRDAGAVGDEGGVGRGRRRSAGATIGRARSGCAVRVDLDGHAHAENERVHAD